eukprot:jgi/Mesvir1/27431/Mv07221-RA.2
MSWLSDASPSGTRDPADLLALAEDAQEWRVPAGTAHEGTDGVAGAHGTANVQDPHVPAGGEPQGEPMEGAMTRGYARVSLDALSSLRARRLALLCLRVLVDHREKYRDAFLPPLPEAPGVGLRSAGDAGRVFLETLVALALSPRVGRGVLRALVAARLFPSLRRLLHETFWRPAGAAMPPPASWEPIPSTATAARAFSITGTPSTGSQQRSPALEVTSLLLTLGWIRAVAYDGSNVGVDVAACASSGAGVGAAAEAGLSLCPSANLLSLPLVWTVLPSFKVAGVTLWTYAVHRLAQEIASPWPPSSSSSSSSTTLPTTTTGALPASTTSSFSTTSSSIGGSTGPGAATSHHPLLPHLPGETICPAAACLLGNLAEMAVPALSSVTSTAAKHAAHHAFPSTRASLHGELAFLQVANALLPHVPMLAPVRVDGASVEGAANEDGDDGGAGGRGRVDGHDNDDVMSMGDADGDVHMADSSVAVDSSSASLLGRAGRVSSASARSGQAGMGTAGSSKAVVGPPPGAVRSQLESLGEPRRLLSLLVRRVLPLPGEHADASVIMAGQAESPAVAGNEGAPALPGWLGDLVATPGKALVEGGTGVGGAGGKGLGVSMPLVTSNGGIRHGLHYDHDNLAGAATRSPWAASPALTSTLPWVAFPVPTFVPPPPPPPFLVAHHLSSFLSHLISTRPLMHTVALALALSVNLVPRMWPLLQVWHKEGRFGGAGATSAAHQGQPGGGSAPQGPFVSSANHAVAPAASAGYTVAVMGMTTATYTVTAAGVSAAAAGNMARPLAPAAARSSGGYLAGSGSDGLVRQDASQAAVRAGDGGADAGGGGVARGIGRADESSLSMMMSLDPMQPLVLFCSVYSHLLVTVDDDEFSGRGHCLSMADVTQLVGILKDVLWNLVWVQEARPGEKTSVGASSPPPSANIHKISRLLSELHSRNSHHPFTSAASFHATGVNYDRFRIEVEDGRARATLVLKEAPFMIPFHERVAVYQALVRADRIKHQGEMARFNIYSGHGQTVLSIRRNYVVEDGFAGIEGLGDALKGLVRIRYVNELGAEEAGVDGGGLFKEFLELLCKAAFDPQHGLFRVTSDNMLYPNPASHLVYPDHAKYFTFLGRILGKAMYEGILVELPFAKFFLSKLLGKLNSLSDLASLDPELYRNLLFVKSYSGDVSDLGLFFVDDRDEFGSHQEVELVRGGANIAVNNDNRFEYIVRKADYKLNQQIKLQSAAFLHGLTSMIEPSWLRMFDEEELHAMISGTDEALDVEDMRAHAVYAGGYSAGHPVMRSFWDVVQEMSPQQQRALLKFSTACSRPPLLGFRYLEPKFCIQRVGGEGGGGSGDMMDDDESQAAAQGTDRLPTASTCMNLLKLPPYRSKRTIREKLLYAISAGAGFDLS